MRICNFCWFRIEELLWNFSIFEFHGSVHRKRIFKCNQQDATLHNLFISVKCSTCFRRFLRPSSGAQKLYIQHRVLCQTFTVTCHCHGTSSNSSTTVAGSSKVFTKYPMLYIQFWAPADGRRNRLKHVEHFTEINKLCNVASCWLYLEMGTKFYLGTSNEEDQQWQPK